MPGTQIQYMSANPQVAYQVCYYQFTTSPSAGRSTACSRSGPASGSPRTGTPTRSTPSPRCSCCPARWAWLYTAIPTAFRTGNKLPLIPNPFSDNALGTSAAGPSSRGPGVKVSGRYAVYQNGILIAHGNPANDYSLPPPAAGHPEPEARGDPVRAERDPARRPLPAVPGQPDRVDLALGAGPAPRCRPPGGAGHGRHCAAQPMMTLNYQVHGLGINEATAPGRQAIGLTVGHIEPGAPVRVTGASMRVSFDGGHTWQPAR